MRRILVAIGLALVVLVGALAVWVVRPIARQAGFAAEYVARRACLCVFASERDLSSCRVEMPDVMAAIDAEVIEEERAVRARIPWIASRTARFEGGVRCALD